MRERTKGPMKMYPTWLGKMNRGDAERKLERLSANAYADAIGNEAKTNVRSVMGEASFLSGLNKSPLDGLPQYGIRCNVFHQDLKEMVGGDVGGVG